MYDVRLDVAVQRMNVVDIPKVSDVPGLQVNCFFWKMAIMCGYKVRLPR